MFTVTIHTFGLEHSVPVFESCAIVPALNFAIALHESSNVPHEVVVEEYVDNKFVTRLQLFLQPKKSND